MLVYCKNPNGVLHIGRYRIYGMCRRNEPTDLPFDLYLQYRPMLEDATYREGTLAKLFDKKFPPIAFKYKEVRWMADKAIDEIVQVMFGGEGKTWSRKKKIDEIKRAIANVNKTA